MTVAIGVLVASAIGMFIYLMQTPSPKIAAVSQPEATLVPDTSKNTDAVDDNSPSPAELSVQPSPPATATDAQFAPSSQPSYSPIPFQRSTPVGPATSYITSQPPPVAVAPTPLPLTFRVAGVREGESLNLRQGPGSNYGIVLKVPARSGGITLGSKRFKNGTTLWREVFVGEYTGFVNEDYLEAESTPP